VLRGPADTGEIRAGTGVGSVRVSQDLQEFTFEPRLPLDNQAGLQYRFEPRRHARRARPDGDHADEHLEQAPFSLSADQSPHSNHGFALRFQSRDELDPPGADVRGQVAYEGVRGVLRPRPNVPASFSADRGNVIPNLMMPWPFGVQTPLSPLGSKLQSLWRHCDFGFRVRDETFHNLDVVGLSWSPLGGHVNADFYPLFELRLAHARHIPDESYTTSFGPKYPTSGLFPGPHEFTTNILEDPRGGQVVVHSRGLGYEVLASDMSINGRGTPLMPFPRNRVGGPFTSFTRRDTSVPRAATQPRGPARRRGRAAVGTDTGQGQVGALTRCEYRAAAPVEVRCFPRPAASVELLRHHAADPRLGDAACLLDGGVDETGHNVLVDPDLELHPNGGFNPSSNPGQAHGAHGDNLLHRRDDAMVRISRRITIGSTAATSRRATSSPWSSCARRPEPRSS
jgi:hypothetical protein